MPLRQDSAYLRFWDSELQVTKGKDVGVPSLQRIVEDMTCISNYSVLKQYSVCGVALHGCGTCRGCRFDGDSAVKNRGGQRTKNLALILLFMKMQFQMWRKDSLPTVQGG
jgi:hypothetical protein